jgi:hypothetical protein
MVSPSPVGRGNDRGVVAASSRPKFGRRDEEHPQRGCAGGRAPAAAVVWGSNGFVGPDSAPTVRRGPDPWAPQPAAKRTDVEPRQGATNGGQPSADVQRGLNRLANTSGVLLTNCAGSLTNYRRGKKGSPSPSTVTLGLMRNAQEAAHRPEPPVAPIGMAFVGCGQRDFGAGRRTSAV